MNKYVLSFLFLLVSATVFGQQKKSVIDLVQSVSAEYNTVNGSNELVGKVYKGVFKQDFSILTSDSAYFYKSQNVVIAFGHVVINQGDTLHIFSDKLNYNGNTKDAILTDNVKMVDKDATLTTNYFIYNTAARIGTYTGGGKLVNKDNTLTSTNGYYFANTRDEYFRYNVVCTTPDAIIKTDTMRYNSGTRIAYFYGPTNIYGKKDKDTLYTENGTYNTQTEQALFGKKNLYKQGTKSLKGDSLFYDRLKGYGKATKNVTFDDREQKMTLKGGLGQYYKEEEKMVMTINPYMILVTQDSIKTDSGKNTQAITVNKDSVSRVPKNSIPQKLTLQGITDSVTKKQPVIVVVPAKKPTLQAITDSVTRKAPVRAVVKPKPAPVITKAKPAPVTKKPVTVIKKPTPAIKTIVKDTGKIIPPVDTAKKQQAKPPANIKTDSIYMVADTIETRMITFKELKTMRENIWLYNHRDTSIKAAPPSVVYTLKNLPKYLTATKPGWPKDTSFLHPYYFGKPAPPVVKPVTAASKKITADSLKNKLKADSLALKGKKALTDTSRVRIVMMYHSAKLFKSDLQAKADSMFWSSSDSTIRCYVNPIIWTQGSQLTGDTINLQMKNKKLDNIDLFAPAFVVNIEKADSVHFNQVSGRQIHGTFMDNKLKTMLVSGNAETIYFNRDTVKNKVTEMDKSESSTIDITFKNGHLGKTRWLGKPVHKFTNIKSVKEEDKILKNFIWKPKDRPASKEAILAPKKPVVKSVDPKKTIGTKPPTGTSAIVKSTGQDSIKQLSPINSIARDTTAAKKKN